MGASTASQDSESTEVQHNTEPSWISEVVEILTRKGFDIKDKSGSGDGTPHAQNTKFISVWLTEQSLDKLRETIREADISDSLTVIGPEATQSLPQYRDVGGSQQGRGLAIVTNQRGPQISAQERAQKRALQF